MTISEELFQTARILLSEVSAYIECDCWQCQAYVTKVNAFVKNTAHKKSGTK